MCGYWMYAEEEHREMAGNTVIYVCRSCGFKEKVFEPK